jgi:hypothetical protein
MDQRLDERYPSNLAVTVTDMAAPEQIASGQIVNVSQSGTCADLSLRFTPGAAVKIQLGDSTLFGHVIYCDGEQPFRTGIEIVNVLIGESDLARLVKSIQAEAVPASVSTKDS